MKLFETSVEYQQANLRLFLWQHAVRIETETDIKYVRLVLRTFKWREFVCKRFMRETYIVTPDTALAPLDIGIVALPVVPPMVKDHSVCQRQPRKIMNQEMGPMRHSNSINETMRQT